VALAEADAAGGDGGGAGDHHVDVAHGLLQLGQGLVLPVAGHAVQQGGDLLLPLGDLTGGDEEEAPGDAVVGHDHGLLVPEGLLPEGLQVVVRGDEDDLGVLVHVRSGEQRGALFAALIVTDELRELPAELGVRLGYFQQFLPNSDPLGLGVDFCFHLSYLFPLDWADRIASSRLNKKALTNIPQKVCERLCYRVLSLGRKKILMRFLGRAICGFLWCFGLTSGSNRIYYTIIDKKMHLLI
jgi:hypothetical protein